MTDEHLLRTMLPPARLLARAVGAAWWCDCGRKMALRKGELHPVHGGLDSDTDPAFDYGQSSFTRQLPAPGTYWFKSYACRATSMKVVVLPRKPTTIKVSPQGFDVAYTQVDRGASVRWKWPDVSAATMLSEYEGDSLVQCFPHTSSDGAGDPVFDARCMYPGTRRFAASVTSGEEDVCAVYVRQAPTFHVVTFDSDGTPSPTLLMAMAVSVHSVRVCCEPNVPMLCVLWRLRRRCVEFAYTSPAVQDAAKWLARTHSAATLLRIVATRGVCAEAAAFTHKLDALSLTHAGRYRHLRLERRTVQHVRRGRNPTAPPRTRREPFNLHPDGGQFDFVWLSARTPHVGPQYVW